MVSLGGCPVSDRTYNYSPANPNPPATAVCSVDPTKIINYNNGTLSVPADAISANLGFMGPPSSAYFCSECGCKAVCMCGVLAPACPPACGMTVLGSGKLLACLARLRIHRTHLTCCWLMQQAVLEQGPHRSDLFMSCDAVLS